MMVIAFFVLLLPKDRSWLVYIHTQDLSQLASHCFVVTIDLSGQKRSIEEYLHQVQQGIQSVQDSEVLNRVLNLVMQASSALKSFNNPNDPQHPFIVKDRFPPAQKNERQLQFKRTCDIAGRKKTRRQLRYIIVNLVVFLH